MIGAALANLDPGISDEGQIVKITRCLGAAPSFRRRLEVSSCVAALLLFAGGIRAQQPQLPTGVSNKAGFPKILAG